MRTGLTKHEKTTDIWFDEKDPLIHIRTHNTDLKKRMLAYSRRYPENCKQTDTDPETGCMEFDIEKGRFSFRLVAGNRHLHRYYNFAGRVIETVPRSLHHSCGSELTRQGISLP